MNVSHLISTTLAAVVCLFLVGSAAPAAAQDSEPLDAEWLLKDGTLYARLLDVPPFVIGEEPRGPRPAILPALYVGFIGLEAFDGYSTSRGLRQGGSESNPLVRWAVAHPTTLWAIKGGAAFASIYVAERLWKTHRRAQAVTLMVASNAIMGVVAARNMSATGSRR